MKNLLKILGIILVLIISAIMHELDMYNEYKTKGILENTSWITKWDFGNKK